eukprot:6462056-Prymnesium_polylepis.1
MASTPSPPNAYCVRCRAAERAHAESHFESRRPEATTIVRHSLTLWCRTWGAAGPAVPPRSRLWFGPHRADGGALLAKVSSPMQPADFQQGSRRSRSQP